MRLKRLWIDKFKNLSDFSVDFDVDEPITVLVGRNGTGKSNLLEALTIIFRDLDLSHSPAFPYRLQYECRGFDVEITANPTAGAQQVEARVDGATVPARTLATTANRPYLPSFVFGYYSGPGSRMERHYQRHQELFYRDLMQSKLEPRRPLFFARQVHAQFVLLAFFLEDDPKLRDFLRDNLGIEGLDSCLFVMVQPPWRSREGNPTFWNARGAVSDLLDRLYENALAPLRSKRRIDVGFRKRATREHVYLYLRDAEAIRRLSGAYPSPHDFFKILESTYVSELLSEVRIRVRANTADGFLTFRELAEGEQQLLMVIGLLRFTREDESLFLLDEPDTHLNPYWSLRYREFLTEHAGTGRSGHILMATHDPLVVAGLRRTQVQILERDGESGRISAQMPDDDPRGMGIAGLLTSEVYGLRSQLDLETQGELARKRVLASKVELNPEERVELDRLTEELGALDFTTAARDPLYERFVRALVDLEAERLAEVEPLTPAQRERQQELAREVLREIVAPDEGSS